MRVINNAEKIAKKINDLCIEGVGAVGDDGSVCIEVLGDEKYTRLVAKVIHEKVRVKHPRVGDGCQEGCYWINNYAEKIHGELQEIY